MATCSSCQAPLWWAKTAKGKRMPIDPEPVDHGRIVLDRRVDGLHCRVLGRGEQPRPDQATYTSHYATCPKAAQHRRPTP